MPLGINPSFLKEIAANRIRVTPTPKVHGAVNHTGEKFQDVYEQAKKIIPKKLLPESTQLQSEIRISEPTTTIYDKNAQLSDIPIQTGKNLNIKG